MIYESKQAAKEAAEKFGRNRMAAGEFIKIVPRNNRIEVYHGYHTDKLDISQFYFRTLKKGDLCWCWSAIDRSDSVLRIFSGEWNDGLPIFSEFKHMVHVYTRNNYEPTGLNIFENEQ